VFRPAAALALLISASLAHAGAIPVPRCCTWENGAAASPVTPTTPAILSHQGGGAGTGVAAADDFVLCESQIHAITSISAEMITSTVAGLVKARLTVYQDCDGRPGQPLFTWINAQVVEQGASGLDGFRRVRYIFTPDAQATPTQPAKPMILRGGVYWVSVVGLTDNLCDTMQMCDQTFWLPASTTDVKGRPAHKAIGIFSDSTWGGGVPVNPWISSDECCNGCIDLAFNVCAESCKIVHDFARDYDATRSSPSLAGGPLIIDARTADDFVVPPCDDRALCYVGAYIATNCNPPRFRMDVYDTDCRFPATFSPPLTADATKFTDTRRDITIAGRVLRVYYVEFLEPRASGAPIVLQGGRNFWISVYAVGSGSASERAYVLGAQRCDKPSCTAGSARFLQPAAVSGRAVGITDNSWRTAAPFAGQPWDTALTVALSPRGVGDPGNATAACPADFDLSGAATVDDIFTFLSAWFTGCP
jgi:hypothetical protein